MAPITELCRLTPKEGQEAEFEAALADTCKTLLKTPGVQGVHTSATLEEDNPIHLLIVDWDSIDSHKAFENNKETYGPFVERIVPVLAAFPSVYHASLSPVHPPVLHNAADKKGSAKSTVTEVLHVYFPAGDAFTAEQIAATAKTYLGFLASLSGNVAGHSGEVAGGWVVEELEYQGEKARAFVAAVGWDSVEAHSAYTKTEHFEKNIPIVKNLEGLKGFEIFHVSTKTW